jgi:hypothetical protein
MQIDGSEQQLANAESSIFNNRDETSNVTEDRCGQLPKHSRQSPSTDEGMHTDKSEEQGPKANGGINESREAGSNTTIEMYGQQAQQDWHKVSIDEGIQRPIARDA